MSNLPARPSYTYTEDDWVQIRAHFMGSILVDLHLHKLAQNVGASWPIKDKDETPAKYLEYSFEELLHAPGIAGQASRFQLLLDILKETAAFDDPFQDMLEGKPDSERPAAVNTDQLLKKFEIPAGFPIEFTGLSAETRELCRGEGATTVGECIALLHNMAQNVILGGEVRQLLNSVAHTDERGIARFLPYRPGTRGLHLAEAIGFMIRNLPEDKRRVCLSNAEPADESAVAALDFAARQLPALLEWFPEEGIQLKQLFEDGQPVERFFLPLNNPEIEAAAARICQRYFNPVPTRKPVREKGGLLSRISGLFHSGG